MTATSAGGDDVQKTTTMKEIPFLQHLSPIALSSNSGGRNGSPESQVRNSKNNINGDNEGGATPNRHYTVATIGDLDADNIPHGAFGLLLYEDSSSNPNSNEEEARMTMMASQLATATNNNDINQYNKLPLSSKARSNNFLIMENPVAQRNRLRGLTSSTYSQPDDTLICTNGIISSKHGLLMRITSRHAALDNSTAATDSIGNRVGGRGQDVTVDISSLLNNNSGDIEGEMLGTTVVKTACFVTHANSNNTTSEEHVKGWSPPSTKSHQDHGGWLHVHMMTSRGAMIRLVFSYPTLTPSDAHFASFLYPSLNETSSSSICIGYEQVCFPTLTTVVYTTNTNGDKDSTSSGGTLYCIDLGDAPHNDGRGSSSSIVTRVWSSIQKTIVPSESLSADDGETYKAVSTPGMVRKLDRSDQPSTRKKARYSIGNVFSSVYSLVVGGDGVNEEYEYNDDGVALEEVGDDGGVNALPPIAAVTALSCTNGTSSNGDGVARVATCHTDGSLCIWVAEATRRKYNRDNDDASMYRPRLRVPSVQCVNSNAADILSSSKITLRGQYNLEEHSYQVALCSGATSVFRVFGGKSFSDFDGEDDSIISFGSFTAQDLILPTGANDAVDMSWNNGLDLLVLFRQSCASVNGTEKEEVASLAVYPLLNNGEDGSYTYSNPLLPSNMTLKQMGMNHKSSSLNLSVSEEFDRYIDISSVKGGSGVENVDDMDMGDADTAQVEANIDKAGLLSIMQPFGRNRPSALAVYRAMVRLELVVSTQDGSFDAINPTAVVMAMRNWKKRDGFEASHPSFPNTTLVSREGGSPIYLLGQQGKKAPLPSPQRGSVNNYAKKHSNKSSRVSDDEEEDTASDNTADAGQSSYRLKWINLLSEIRREELHLNEVLSILPVPLDSSLSINLVMRTGMASLLSLDDAVELSLKNEEEKLMAELDDISLDLLATVMADPDCRRLLSEAEALLYSAASKVTPLVSSVKANDLMVHLGNVGSLALGKMSLTEQELLVFTKFANLDLSFAEKWLQSPTSLSSKVSSFLAITKTFETMPNLSSEWAKSFDVDAHVSATALISSMVDSTRLLALSRLIVVRSMPQSAPAHLNSMALRSVLYSTALSWAFKQPSSYDRTRTVLEEYLSHEMTKAFYSSGTSTAIYLAYMCVASSFSILANESSDNLLIELMSPSHEPRVVLRLLAPLVKYPNFASLGNDQKWKETIAECLLAEAVVLANHYDRDTSTTSPKELWSLASNFLSDSISIESLNTANFNEIFECLKGSRDKWWTFEAEPHHEELLYEALTMILQISDDDDDSTPETEEELQRLCMMQTTKSLFLPLALCSKGVSVDQSFIDGNVWRDIPRMCMYNFVKALMKVSNLMHRVDTMDKYLKNGETSLSSCCTIVLEAVKDAIHSITSTLPPGMSRDMPEVSDLYSAAFQTSVHGKLWGEALQTCISNPEQSGKNDNLKHLILEMVRAGDIGKVVDMSMTVVDDSVDLFQLVKTVVESAALEQKSHDVESCLDHWGCLYTLHASRGNWSHAAEAMDQCGKNTVSNALSKSEIESRTASKKIMDQASLSAHACAHSVSLVDKSSRQYIGEVRDTLLTKDDIDRRAVRASALRVLSMDECSPDSIASILKSHSLDTIDILARMGYYEHAIAVAAGVSSKRMSNPSGVDVFFDSLRHILCTYLVPAAVSCVETSEEDNQLESRLKIIQLQTSSSVCEQCTANSKSFTPNDIPATSPQATTAMNLLRQYTVAYSKRCVGLGLSVASAILDLKPNMVLPIWLKDLCVFGSPANENNIFAQRHCLDSNGANPSALVRLLMSHHKYGDACDAVTAILSSQASHSTPSNRLPEKGNIDYVPYDLIDSLWQSIEIIATDSASKCDRSQKTVEKLLQSRNCMENSLADHFQALKTSEDGLRSTRILSKN